MMPQNLAGRDGVAPAQMMIGQPASAPAHFRTSHATRTRRRPIPGANAATKERIRCHDHDERDQPDHPDPPPIDEQRALAVLEAAKADLMKLAAGDMVPVRLDLIRAVYTAAQVAQVAATERPLFEQTFKDFPLHLIDHLEPYALATWAAESQYRRLEVEERAAERRPPAALLEECRTLREHLMAAGAYVFRDDDKVLEVLTDIRRGTGFLDLADDLKRIAELFTAHWPRVEGRCEVTHADVQRAAKLADTLLETIASPLQRQLSTWADLRLRAWTRLSRAYTEIRDAAGYLHRKAPDKLAAYPSLHAYPRKKAA